MHKLEELKEMLMEELEAYSSKGKLDVGSLDVVDKLAHAIKNICKIIDTQDEGYSGGVYMYDGVGSYRDRGRRGSYDRDGRSYVRGQRTARRDAMGRYSGTERDMDEMITELQDMMPDLPEDKKREVQKFISKIEQM